MQWKIYYADGPSRNSDDGSATSIPRRDNVVCIQQLEPMLNREILNRWELYRYDPSVGLWFGTTDEGMTDRLLDRRPIGVVLAGRRVTRARFRAIYTAATTDPDFSAIEKIFDEWESARYGTDEAEAAT